MDACACRQIRPQLPHTRIKCGSCHLGGTVRGHYIVDSLVPRNQISDPAMVDLHSFGYARRSRGVNYISQVLRSYFYFQILTVLFFDLFRGLLQLNDVWAGVADSTFEPTLNEGDFSAAVTQHVSYSLFRIAGIDRHERAAGLHHTQQANDHLDA